MGKVGIFIVGGMKCGTTSLFNYLIHHNHIAGGMKKEPFYFSTNYKGDDSYTGYEKQYNNRFNVDASTNYLVYHVTAERIYKYNSSAKIIILCREPIRRCWSHWCHNKRVRGRDRRTLLQAIKDKETDLTYKAYKTIGLYKKHLDWWYSIWPKKQICVVKSEDLFCEPDNLTGQIFDFLEIDKPEKINYKNWSPKQSSGQMPDDCVDVLCEYYKIPNKELNDSYGISWGYQ